MFVRVLASAAALAVLGTHCASSAFAQTPTDPSFDQRVTRATAVYDPETARAEAILTGRDDIVLLGRRKLFALSGSLGGGYTDNAALSPSEPESDRFWSADVALRAQTRIAGRVDIHAQAGLLTTRYAELSELDYGSFAGSIGAHTQWRQIDFDVVYTPVIVFDSDFGDRQLTQHRVSASAGRSFTLPRNAVLRTSVSAERIDADPDPYSNSAITISAIAGIPLSSRRRINGFASVRAVARNYDNYFEGLVGAEREDRLIEGAVGVSWSPRENFSIDARWTQARNRSTSDVNRYRAGSGGISLAAVIRF